MLMLEINACANLINPHPWRIERLRERGNNENGFALITLLIFIALFSPIMMSMTSLIATEYYSSQNYAAYYRHIFLTDLARVKIQEEDPKTSETCQSIEIPELKKDNQKFA